MAVSLPAAARRVQAALQAHGLDATIREFPTSTRTAAEAAASIGCTVAQIAKSLVFRGERTGRAVLVVASGANRVNEERLAGILEEPVGRADAAFVREKTGYAIGGVPPVAHAEPPIVVIDEDLLELEEIWAAAGTPNAVFRLTPAELVSVTAGRVARII